MAKASGWVVRVSVLFIFLLNVEISLVNTALGEVAKAFPDADPVIINLVSTSAVIFMFLCSLLVGRLATRHNMRTLVIVALVIYTIGGVGGFFLSFSLWTLLLSRALVGVGAGISAPLVGAIVARLYEGPDRARMLGWANGFSSLIAVFLTMLAGWLAAMDWRYTFLAYGVFALILLLEVYALPSLPPLAKRSADGSTATVERPRFTPRQKAKLVLIAVFVFLNLMAGMLLLLKMPIMVTMENIGGPIQISWAFSTFTVGAFLSSMAFGWLHRATGRYALALYLALSAAGFVPVVLAQSIVPIVVGLFLFGLGSGMFIPAIQMKALDTGPQVNVAYAMSVAFGALFLGQFAASFAEKLLAPFGDASPRSLMTVGFGLFVAYLFAYLGWTRFVPANWATENDEVAGDEPTWVGGKS